MNNAHPLIDAHEPSGSAIRAREVAVSEQPVRAGLYRLPCSDCGSYYFSDEPSCPMCRIHFQEKGACKQSVKGSFYRLPCAKCGAYYFTDEPGCPRCGADA